MAVSKNVYELAQERLELIFKEFDTICVSFSGGKDSGVLLNLCIDYIRRNNLKRKLCVFHMDYEIQYTVTIDYVDRILEANKDILEVYRVCVPFKVTTCTSMYQSYWRPWDESMKELWVRQMPQGSYTKEAFPFYTEKMWDYEFQMHFAKWLHQRKDAVRTCFLIGIRTQESFNRWRSIHLNRKYQMYHNYRWTSKIGNDIFNAYPIYDWKTTDIWTANGKFGFDYNHLYDLYYKAGVNIERQRVASPFLCEAQESLALYKVIDPNTWGKMIGRVNGVNFTGIYGGTHAMGWQSVRIPEGYTWKSFMQFLLSTLPEETRRNYLIAVVAVHQYIVVFLPVVIAHAGHCKSVFPDGQFQQFHFGRCHYIGVIIIGLYLFYGNCFYIIYRTFIYTHNIIFLNCSIILSRLYISSLVRANPMYLHAWSFFKIQMHMRL